MVVVVVVVVPAIVVMIMLMIAVIVVIVIVVVPIIAVTRYVLAVVPIVTDKVHGTAAGIVFGAVPRPVLLMSRRHVEINRLACERGVPMNHRGTRIDDSWGLRRIAEIDLAKKSRFPDIDGNANIGCHDWGGR
jgi:hypothetical protein